MLKIKLMLAGVVVMLLVAGAAGAQVISGQVAPNFTLTDSYGQKHSLAEYKGKFVVLEWFNPECPFVKKHYQRQYANITKRIHGPWGGMVVHQFFCPWQTRKLYPARV